MQISTRKETDRTVLTIDGDFLGEPDQKKFRQQIKRIIDSGTKKIIVDLARIHHINSCGLGSLVAALVAVKRIHGNLTISHPGDGVKSLLKITKLNAVFKISST